MNYTYKLLFIAILLQGCSKKDEVQNNYNDPLVGYWHFYSSLGVNFSGLSPNEIIYYDNNKYCDDLYFNVKSDGTFEDYYDFISPGNPGCSGISYKGRWTYVDGEYEIKYNNSPGADIIDYKFPDSNTLTFEFDGVYFTYKKEL